jgi:hypothetical protein
VAFFLPSRFMANRWGFWEWYRSETWCRADSWPTGGVSGSDIGQWRYEFYSATGSLCVMSAADRGHESDSRAKICLSSPRRPQASSYSHQATLRLLWPPIRMRQHCNYFGEVTLSPARLISTKACSLGLKISSWKYGWLIYVREKHCYLAENKRLKAQANRLWLPLANCGELSKVQKR